jgi:hypothetical protein
MGKLFFSWRLFFYEIQDIFLIGYIMESYGRFFPVLVGRFSMKRMVVVMLLCGMGAGLRAQTAYIRELSGTVELKGPGSDVWRPAKTGDVLEETTVISTGFRSIARLAIGNSVIAVRPLTRLTLGELVRAGNNETVRLELRTGSVRAEVAPPSAGRTDFRVRSPVATASVRGTVFEFDTENLTVSEGVVQFSPGSEERGTARRSVAVRAGEASRIDRESGRTLPPLAAAETERSLPPLAGESGGSAADTSTKGGMTLHFIIEPGPVGYPPS